MRFADVLEIRNGRNQRQVECPNGKYPIYGSGGVMGYANSYICEANTVVIGRKGNINNPIFVEEPFWNVDTAFGLIPHADVLIPKYLFYFCENYNFEKLNTTVTIPSLTKANLLQVEIDVPEIGIQKSRVGILDKIEHSCRLLQQEALRLDQLVKSRFVEMFGEPVTNSHGYEQVTIGNACTLINGRAFKPSEWGEKGLPIVRIQNLNDMNASFNYYAGEVSEQHLIDNGMLLFSWSGTPGTSFGAFMWNRGPGALNQHIFKVIPKLDFDLDYLRYAMNGQLTTIIEKAHGGVGLQHITKAELEKICLLHPEMAEQKRFAAFAKQVDKSKFRIQKSLSTSRKLWTLARINAIMNMDFSTQRSL